MHKTNQPSIWRVWTRDWWNSDWEGQPDWWTPERRRKAIYEAPIALILVNIVVLSPYLHDPARVLAILKVAIPYLPIAYGVGFMLAYAMILVATWKNRRKIRCSVQ